MSKKADDKGRKFREYRYAIQDDIKDLVFHYKDFSFSLKKDKGFLSNKKSPAEISGIEAEEFMMRFFGLYVQKSKLVKFLKIALFVGIIFYAYFNWDLVQSRFQIIIDHVPFIKATLTFLLDALNSKLLIGLFLLSFFVNLFFISFPDEIYFVSYLLAGHDVVILIPVIMAGGLLGLTVDYFIGKILGNALLKKLLKKKYYQFKFAADKWGGLLLIFGNLVPSPVQWFSVGLGAFNYGYIKFIFFCAIGKVSKYMGLFFGLNYYTNTVNPFIHDSIRPALENLKICLNETNTTVPFISR